jgi:hypothetical protein
VLHKVRQAQEEEAAASKLQARAGAVDQRVVRLALTREREKKKRKEKWLEKSNHHHSMFKRKPPVLLFFFTKKMHTLKR